MFNVRVTPEFERWFSALDGAQAELVATATSLLEKAGPELDGVRASRGLLWYDGLPGETPPFGVSPHLGWIGASVNAFQEFVFWHREAVRTLESTQVRSRLTELHAGRAEAAFEAIEKLRAKLEATRVHATYQAWRHAHPPAFSIRPAAVAQSLRRSLFEVLEALEVDRYAVLPSLSGLRELTLEGEPALRVLYGLDVPARRVLLISGEPLDRTYYGDSVKLAERTFAEFLRQERPDETAFVVAGRTR